MAFKLVAAPSRCCQLFLNSVFRVHPVFRASSTITLPLQAFLLNLLSAWFIHLYNVIYTRTETRPLFSPTKDCSFTGSFSLFFFVCPLSERPLFKCSDFLGGNFKCIQAQSLLAVLLTFTASESTERTKGRTCPLMFSLNSPANKNV